MRVRTRVTQHFPRENRSVDSITFVLLPTFDPKFDSLRIVVPYCGPGISRRRDVVESWRGGSELCAYVPDEPVVDAGVVEVGLGLELAHVHFVAQHVVLLDGAVPRVPRRQVLRVVLTAPFGTQVEKKIIQMQFCGKTIEGVDALEREKKRASERNNNAQKSERIIR